MPVYEYEAVEGTAGCDYCSRGFECVRRMADAPLTQCPRCGAAVRKIVSAPSIGSSRTGFDDRARGAGFHKLKRLGKGEYEKQY
jgi:putative FmdB family regulatory protein